MTTAISLQSLPAEIQQQLDAFLGFFDTRSLRLTCRMMHDRLLEPPSVFTPQDFEEAESKSSYASRNNLWPCYTCRRILNADNFADNCRKTPYGRSGKSSAKRFCIKCGCTHTNDGQVQRRPRYHAGQVITVNQVYCIFCRKCGLVKRYSDRYRNYWATDPCDDCWP